MFLVNIINKPLCIRQTRLPRIHENPVVFFFINESGRFLNPLIPKCIDYHKGGGGIVKIGHVIVSFQGDN